MAVKAKRTKGCPLEKGQGYLLKIQDVSQVNSDYGEQAEITFKVHEGDSKGEKFSQRFGLTVSEKSYLGAMILAIDGILLDQDYDIEEYEGKIVGALIDIKPRSEKGNIGIVGFYPPGKPGRTAKETEQEEEKDDIPI